jgi:tellurite resistance protein TehA-like permease
LNLLWLLFSFRGRLDAEGFTPWWALYAVPVFFAGFAAGVFLCVQHEDIRPPLAYAGAALALAMIAGWVFLMESLRRAPSVRG